MTPVTRPGGYDSPVFADVERILIPRDRIAARVGELGAEIARDLDALDDGGDIVLLPILTGSVIFVADLMRHLPQRVRISVVTVSSYPGASTSSKGAALVGAIPEDLAGRHVLIVDDILDSGGTIRLIRDTVMARNARSVRACVLLRKKIEAAMSTPCEYVGFDIEDEFVVGYGLDYDDYYRNLPDVAVLRPEAQ